MRHWLLLVAIVGLGCERPYWVASADLRQAQAAEARVPGDHIAVKAVAHDPMYLRYSQLHVGAPGAEPVTVRAPNKRGKRVAGAILLGLGSALVVTGIGVIGYGVSIRGHDAVGSGIVAGLGALPLGVGIGLAIPGVVLVIRARGPSDVVTAGEPSIVYFPSR